MPYYAVTLQRFGRSPFRPKIFKASDIAQVYKIFNSECVDESKSNNKNTKIIHCEQIEIIGEINIDSNSPVNVYGIYCINSNGERKYQTTFYSFISPSDTQDVQDACHDMNCKQENKTYKYNKVENRIIDAEALDLKLKLRKSQKYEYWNCLEELERIEVNRNKELEEIKNKYVKKEANLFSFVNRHLKEEKELARLYGSGYESFIKCNEEE